MAELIPLTLDDHKADFPHLYKIDPAYDSHVTLRCEAHPMNRWHTKNIDFIGARKIYWAGYVGSHNPYEDQECDCPGSMLEVVPRIIL